MKKEKETYIREEDQPVEVLEEPEFVEEIPDEHTEPICKTCNGTGAVAENIVAGKIDKYMDCPDCVKCPECTNGKLANGADCPTCFKGRVPRNG